MTHDNTCNKHQKDDQEWNKCPWCLLEESQKLHDKQIAWSLELLDKNKKMSIELISCIPYLEKGITFFKFQRPRKEFWPNREEGEGILNRLKEILEAERKIGRVDV